MDQQTMKELMDLFSDRRLQLIGRLACRAHLAQKGADETTVKERQNQVGPGATNEAVRAAGQAAAAVEAEILDALGAAQVERDEHVLRQAVTANIDDDHTIVERLGHELTDQNRYALAAMRRAQLAQTSAPGDAGGTGVLGEGEKRAEEPPA